jgi:hypothetical protein
VDIFLDTDVQVLFLVGIPLVIGPEYTKNFFMQRKRWKGTALFFAGILLVFFKWTFVGILIEGFGFINLFGCVVLHFSALLCSVSERLRWDSDFVPAAVAFLSSLPVVGSVFQLPLIRTLLRRSESVNI